MTHSTVICMFDLLCMSNESVHFFCRVWGEGILGMPDAIYLLETLPCIGAQIMKLHTCMKVSDETNDKLYYLDTKYLITP